MPEEPQKTSESLKADINSLEMIVAELEMKISDLYSRPRMPYTTNAVSGDRLELDGDLIPIWVTPPAV